MKKKMFLALGLCLSTALAGLTAQAEDDTEKGGKAYWQVENAADYVTLGEYTGLDVEKTIYQLTDEDVDIELDNVLYEQAELVDAGRGAEIGDVVNMDLTIKVDGEEETVPDYTIDLGYGELGSDFDTEVNGHSAGETLSFDITYDGEEEDIIEEWIGKTVSFTVKLNSVQVNDVPQFSDEWVKANSDFDDMDSYREDLREKLTEKSDKQSTYEAASAAIQTAVENSTFDGYPQDLYDIVYDQQVAQYEMMAEMFGISLDELYESYEMTEEDIKDQAVEAVDQVLFVNVLAEKEGITLEEDDTAAYAEENYADYGFESAEDMLEADTSGELAFAALSQKVALFILDKANVTEKVYDYAEEDLVFDDSSAEDIEFDDWEFETGDEDDWVDIDLDDEDWAEDY